MNNKYTVLQYPNEDTNIFILAPINGGLVIEVSIEDRKRYYSKITKYDLRERF